MIPEASKSLKPIIGARMLAVVHVLLRQYPYVSDPYQGDGLQSRAGCEHGIDLVEKGTYFKQPQLTTFFFKPTWVFYGNCDR